ncbi:hypothetical protein MARI_04410 [Marinobacter sp. JH2]|nr:polysaccharide pyruvyl transferase family protein [Marinobacter sp. JH2]QBM16361.1 hypothetical protein MARI_04410 [Marinobacter sp. JH2]
MVALFRRVLNLSGRFLSDLLFIKVLGRVPVYYYAGELNVGDALNPFLIEKVVGRKAYQVKTKFFRHLLVVGSVIQHANKNSLVFGSGVISSDLLVENKEFLGIGALRGKWTRDYLLENCRNIDAGDVLNIPLGDPALLLPKVYPLLPIKKIYRIGVIPHYVDKSCEVVNNFRVNLREDVVLIDVQQEVVPFLTDLSRCDFVISSSLHGLILADAYGVPNVWCRFSDNLLGGDFKFLDYYSVTDAVSPKAIFIGSEKKLQELVDDVASMATIKKYQGDLNALYSGFRSIVNKC